MFTSAGKAAASSEAVYIESVFSTYLYTGDGTNKTLNLGIDLAGKGGLTWIKSRNNLNTVDHLLFDTARGNDLKLSSNLTAASQNQGAGCWSPTSTGFTVNNGFQPNYNGTTYASWTFREQAKFFDVVTFTASAAAAYTFNHNLGSTPGFVIIKPTSVAGSWYCYHTSLGVNKYLLLNSTAASATNPSGNWAATSTTFTVPTDFLSGGTQTYVAYLFANNAGGFGPAGTDNVISCGSFTTNGSGVATVDLGYEPQFILFKRTDSADNWEIADTMRGFSVNSNGTSSSVKRLNPNTSDAETTSSNFEMYLTSTGFKTNQYFYNATYIYIAIRRGPMKTPTSGTSVFSPVARTGTGSAASITGVGFPPDLVMFGPRSIAENKYEIDRLRGAGEGLITNSTSGGIGLGSLLTLNMGGISMSDGNSAWNQSAATYVNWFFGRAPGFFDVVCYTGTGSATTFNHNLTVVPELMIVKSRNNATNWAVYCAYLGGANPANRYVLLNSSNGFGGTAVYWNDTAPTSTVFTVGTTASTNTSAYTYVNYLFATCAGVSKVGSYTGTGALQTIDCGFAAGARFVLIKRTDSTGDWWVYDSARGITSGNDPYLFLNSTAAEVTNTNYVDTASTGFQVTAAAPAGLNANGGTYIFLAIA